ncbi:MAG TPA: hypothetical protein VIP09_11690 [Dehalococcoidia bacterium]
MNVEHLLARAQRLPDSGVASDEARAAAVLADALDALEEKVGVIVDALNCIEPLIPEDEARGYVAARLRALAAELEST